MKAEVGAYISKCAVREMRALHCKCSLTGLLGALSLTKSVSECVQCKITCLSVSHLRTVFRCLSQPIRKHDTGNVHVDAT